MDARTHADGSTAANGLALGLAVCGALSLAVADAVGFLTPETEALFSLSTILGWVLLAWALVLGGAVAFHLVRSGPARRVTTRVDALLVVASVAVVAVAVVIHPLMGSGSGVG